MPREIKTTLAVDGEQAFKRAINEAHTSMRNLGTQLTLASAQFKKDGDAMKLMETRSKTLKAEIDQQEAIVKALEKAVEDSTKAYGANSEKTEKWEAELNRAKASLVNLQSELTLNDSGLDRNGKAFDESSGKAADYQATLKTIGKNVSFQTITSGISGITGTIESAIKKVLSFAKVIRETFADAGEWADTLKTDAIKYKMDPEELQRWQYAAKIVDTDVETVFNARDKMVKKVKGGWKDDGIDMWEMLGIKLRDPNTGNWREDMDIMFEVGETLMNMEKVDGNSIRADAYAMQLFGKSWRDMLPLFTAGRKEWEKAKAEAPVVSNERTDALTEMNDADEALRSVWDVTKYSFLADLSPMITEVTKCVTEMLKAFNEWMDSEDGKQAMQDLSDALKSLFEGLKNVSFKDAIDAVAEALKGIKNALLWLDEHKQDVFTALEVIAGGFALLKAAELAMNIGKIVSGFRALWAGAKNPLPSLPGSGGKAADGIAQATGGSNLATAASGAGSAGVTLGGLFGSGTTFSMMGGMATFAPLALMGLGGYAGWSMVNANLHDENLNQIYGYGHLTGEEGSSGGLIDTMTPEQWAAAARYFSIYRDSSKWGTEEAYAARDELFGLLERGGYTNTEAAVDLLENTFDRYLSGDEGNDLVSKILLRHPEVFGGEAWSGTFGQAGALFQGANRDVIAGAIEDAIYNSGAGPVKGRWSNVGDGAEDILTGGDLRMFRGLPGEMQEKVQVGVQRGVSGIRVQLDGADVGRLIAPYVNEYLGRQAQ